ncbi:SusC/RagA family TonB-linked outer membrane protein [Portibacter marinus]|uniref:SusC/RagA family TonB-linked outer membrane protein n=1 Tax=Portibacter marinus TaxID=2898660 RepID=UPI001F3BEE92|nr:SusC/RagA family TonB-linked outer membrane protein [Portibacter marinus]
MNKRLLTMCMVLFSFVFMQAQQTVTGTVTGTDGFPLIGANVTEKGTTNGTVTDLDGNFSLQVQDGATIVVSLIGFEAAEYSVAGQTNFDITLEEGVALDEVVVTALGITRDKKALGYSVTEVDGGDFTEARENNVINSLAGKVAGVNVTSAATGPGGSSRVIIRGNTALDPNANNQPLYVVDGVPINNDNLGSAGMWGGTDLGDGISNINPDDIETMTVLKGASATALYGSRGQNGVILITTKKGSKRKGLGVEYNGNFVAETPLDYYTDRQFQYGSGSNGQIAETQDQALAWTRSSWGRRMEGQQVIQFDGSTAPYSSNRDNFQSIYNSGGTFTNTVAFNAGADNVSFRASMSDMRSNGLFENVSLDRNTVTARGNANLGDKITVDVKANYINQRAKNRPALSDTPHNPGHLTALASSVDVDLLRNYIGENGEYIPYSTSAFRVNPYWGVYNQFNGDTRDRLIGHVSATYHIIDGLSLQAKYGTDWSTTRRQTWDGIGTPHLSGPGRINEAEWRIREQNPRILLNFDRDINSNFSLNLNVGGEQWIRDFERLSQNGNDFIIPGLRTIGNTKNQSLGYGFSGKQVNSLFGAASIGYKGFLYLDLTARNDWSSTLPSDNRSYFYPSVSTSLILSDVVDIDPNIISFAKLRASFAEVGGDTDPYRLALTYGINGQPVDGNPKGSIAQGQIPNQNLKPTSTNSYEFGGDFRFINNRVGLDVAYYNTITSNQIIAVGISPTSGYGSVVVNAGEIRNSGVELLLNADVISNYKGLRWNSSFNFARNYNEVSALDEEGKLNAIRLGTSRQRNTFIEARLGQPYGSIVGYAWARDDSGEKIHDENGLPVASDTLSILGNGIPDWTGGWTNTFSFKGFSLSTLIDIRWGGEIHSMTNLAGYSSGTHVNTLEGREGWIASEDARIAAGVEPADWTPTGGLERNGVFVNPETYFGRIASDISEEFIYSADQIRLRQMTFTYTVGREVMDRIPFTGLSISLVGRNLGFIHKKIPNVDPESNYNNGNAQGLEYSSIPVTRSFGLNVNAKF